MLAPEGGTWTGHSAFDTYLLIKQLGRQLGTLRPQQRGDMAWITLHNSLLAPVAEERSRHTGITSYPHLDGYVAFMKHIPYTLCHLIFTMYHFTESKTKALMGEAACPGLVVNHWLSWVQDRPGYWIPFFSLGSSILWKVRSPNSPW